MKISASILVASLQRHDGAEWPFLQPPRAADYQPLLPLNTACATPSEVATGNDGVGVAVFVAVEGLVG